MKKLLGICVKKELFQNKPLPEKTSKRYFPRNQTIRNHMTHARRKLAYSLIDQECLQEKIKEWKEEDVEMNIYFRPKGISLLKTYKIIFPSKNVCTITFCVNGFIEVNNI